MKKKFFAMYALAGALVASPVFTSCVDSEESPSVTAQRELNASKIKALTELYNAQAQAEKAKADAEVTLKNAEAAYQQALAEAQLATAADKVRQTKEAQEKFALEIEKIKAQYEKEIAQYNAEKIQWENTLWNNTESHIGTVYSYYNQAVNNVNSLNENLLKQLTAKSLTEANAVTAEQALTQQIASLNKEKATKERELAKWEEIKKLQPSKDEYQTKLDELEVAAYDLHQNKIPAAEAVTTTAEEAYEAAVEATKENEALVAYMEAFEALNVADISVDLQGAIENYWKNYTQEYAYQWHNYQNNWENWQEEEINTWNEYLNAENSYNTAYNNWLNAGSDPDTEPVREDFGTTWTDYWNCRDREPRWESYAPNLEAWKDNEPKAEDFESTFGKYEEYIVVEDSVKKFEEAFGYTPEGFTVSYPVLTDKESNIQYGTYDLEEELAQALNNAEADIEYYTGEAWEVDADGKIQLSNGWELATDGVNFTKWGNSSENTRGWLYSVKDVEGMLEYRKQLVAEQKEAITAKEKEITDAKAAEKTEAEIEVLNNELKGLNDKLAKLEDTRLLNAHLTWANEQVAFYTEQKAEIEEAQKELAANLATVKDNTPVTEALASLEETAVAYLDALTEQEVLEEALAEIGNVYVSNGALVIYNGEYGEIQNLMNGIVDVQDLIDNCTERLQEIENIFALGNLQTLVRLEARWITIYNPSIDQYTSTKVNQFVWSGGNDGYTYEDALVLIEAQIENLKKQIEIQEALAKKYEAELDALLSTGAEA